MNQYSIKYRPRTFNDLIGQPALLRDLEKRRKTMNWPRAMLLRGNFGTGKTTAAHIIAMTLQCTQLTATNDPCGECPSCRSIKQERFDRDTEMLDGGQLGHKDSVIDFTSNSRMRALYDKNRIYIIEEADQLSTAAVNALLKILEAPQDNVYFILLSMVNNGIPPAIRSRCQTFNFNPINVKDTMQALKYIMEQEGLWQDENIPVEFRTEGLAAIAVASKGSLREAFQLLERCIVGEHWTQEEIQQAFNVVDETSTFNVLKGLLALSKDYSLWTTIYKADPAELYNYLTLLLTNAMVYKTTGYVDDERFEGSTKQITNSEHFEKLFNWLTTYPQLTKPYVRRADLLAAIINYYKESEVQIPKRDLPTRNLRLKS